MKKVIVTVLLLALIAACGAGTYVLRDKSARIRAERDALVSAAEDRRSQAQAAFDAVDRNALDDDEDRLAAQQAALEEALAEAEALEEENKALAAQAQESEAALSALREQGDNEYYLTIYQSLREGMEKVEALIEGN